MGSGQQRWSFLAAAPDATFTFARDHCHTEQHIRATGLEFTFNRSSLCPDYIPLMAWDHQGAGRERTGGLDIARGRGRCGGTSADRQRIVLDTFAVLALLEGEPRGQRVADILSSEEPWMTLVNVGEVTHIVERGRGKAAADVVFADLLANERPDGGTPIQLLPVVQELVRRAATLKDAGGLSYADCFAGAAAAILGCPVLTGDPEFVVAERAGVTVNWL